MLWVPEAGRFDSSFPDDAQCRVSMFNISFIDFNLIIVMYSQAVVDDALGFFIAFLNKRIYLYLNYNGIKNNLMKPSEKELEARLWEKTHPKTIDITIDGEYSHEKLNEPLEKVDETLAYKKTHKPQREDECTGMCNTNVYSNNNPLEKYTDTDDCCMGDKYYKDDKCFDGSKINKAFNDTYQNKVHHSLETPVSEHDSKTPFEKMSKEEKKELKSLLEKSKEISGAFNARKNVKNLMGSFNTLNTKDWSDFGKINTELLPNEKLLKEWKDYKEQVNDFIEKHPKLPKIIVNAMMLDEYPEKKPVDSRPWEIQEFEKITKQMFDTYQKKNADYGNSFDDLFNEFGMTSALLRIKDKYNRLKSITEKNKIEVKNESVEDTLLDMANYAILTVIKLRRDNAER